MKARFSLVKTGFVALTCAGGLLATTPPAHAPERVLQAPPWDAELRRLTLEQLYDGGYHLPLVGDEETPIRFHRGQGSIKYGEGATEQVHAGLVGDLVAFGDLDGDRVADAAVVVFIEPGGSGTFIHLLAMHDREGTPVQAGREFLGDRVRVQNLSISGGRIFVTMLAHGPGDGLCCPTVELRRAFTYRPTGRRPLHGRRLVPRQLLVVESPLPGETIATDVEVRGTTSTHPSGDGLAYLVYDARGGVIGMGKIPVAADLGSAGAFAAPVSFLAGAGGPGRIEIVDVDQGDGSALARASVQVLLEAAAAALPPAPRQIVLESPESGAAVDACVEVRGWISTVPFENNLTYRLYSEGGVVIDRGWIMVQATSVNGARSRSRSPWRAPMPPAQFASRCGTVSEADGSLFASTTVQVFLWADQGD